MKKSLSLFALAVVAVVPIAAHSEELSVRACANAYIAENFADRQASIRVEDSPTSYAPRLPLAAYTDAKVKLIATEPTTGRVLGTATCSNRSGTVTVKAIT